MRNAPATPGKRSDIVRSAEQSGPLRILYTCWVNQEDGSAVHVREVVRELQELGCEVRILWHRGTPREPGTSSARRLVWRRFLARLLHEPKEFLESMPGFFREWKEAHAMKPDLLLSRYDCGKCSSVLASRLLNVPMITEVNALYDDEVLVYQSEYLHYPTLMRWIERKAIRGSRGVLTVSEVIRERILRRFGLSGGNVLANPNGARLPDLPREMLVRQVRSALNINATPLVVFAGSFQPFHGIDLLHKVTEEMLEQGTDAGFVFIGDGPGRTSLENLQERFSSKVRVCGRLPTEKVRNYLGGCDIGVMSESNAYGSPIKVAEYMAAGLAVVAPDYLPIREFLEENVSGSLFSPGDKNGLIRQLSKLIRDKELRDQLGRAAQERIRQRFSWSHNAERILDFAKTAARSVERPQGKVLE